VDADVIRIEALKCGGPGRRIIFDFPLTVIERSHSRVIMKSHPYWIHIELSIMIDVSLIESRPTPMSGAISIGEVIRA
jgi:hypothetical protein